MFKWVRNIIIVIAVAAAAFAAYVTLFPSYPHSIVIVNRSGQTLSNVKVSVHEISGKEVASTSAASVAHGQSIALGHALKAAQVTATFTLAGQSHDHTNPYLDYSSGTSWTFEIEPDAGVKIAQAAQ